LFSDDVESGTLLQTDTPPGKWSSCFPTPCDWLGAAAAGAHRGSHGIRITDSDSGTGGSGVVNGLKESFAAPVSGDLYLRAWFRFTPTSSAPLKISLMTVQNHLNSVIQSIVLALPDATVVSGGFELVDGQPKYVSDGTSQVLSQGEWHLMEVALLGLATAQGQRRMWIDRAELLSHPVDWSGGEGWQAVKFVLGELNADEGFTGTIDFDDVVADGLPVPSHLAVLAQERAVLNGCVPLSIEARDTVNDAPADALHPLTSTLHAQGAGNLYASSDCSGTGGGNTLALTLPAGAHVVTASFRPLQRGTVLLSAEDPDLLPSATTALLVTGPATQLAFPRAAPVAYPGKCSPEVWLELEDDANTPVAGEVSLSAALSAPVPLFADADCATAITSVSLPAGATGVGVYFRGDAAGTFSLTASAAGLTPGQQEEEVTAPIARVSAPITAVAGEATSLDGSSSTPSRGAQLTSYRWRELTGPTGVQLPDQPVQALTLKEPGDYVFELVVTDTAGVSSAPVTAPVHVEGPAPAVPKIGGCSSAAGGSGWLVLLALLGLLRFRTREA